MKNTFTSVARRGYRKKAIVSTWRLDAKASILDPLIRDMLDYTLKDDDRQVDLLREWIHILTNRDFVLANSAVEFRHRHCLIPWVERDYCIQDHLDWWVGRWHQSFRMESSFLHLGSVGTICKVHGFYFVTASIWFSRDQERGIGVRFSFLVCFFRQNLENIVKSVLMEIFYTFDFTKKSGETCLKAAEDQAPEGLGSFLAMHLVLAVRPWTKTCFKFRENPICRRLVWIILISKRVQSTYWHKFTSNFSFLKNDTETLFFNKYTENGLRGMPIKMRKNWVFLLLIFHFSQLNLMKSHGSISSVSKRSEINQTFHYVVIES